MRTMQAGIVGSSPRIVATQPVRTVQQKAGATRPRQLGTESRGAGGVASGLKFSSVWGLKSPDLFGQLLAREVGTGE
jgi:hypothetical protein